MAAVMLRSVQVNSKSKLLPCSVSCIDLKTNISTSGGPCNSRKCPLPQIRPVRPGGQWGEMNPKICWLWDRQRKEIKQWKTLKAKVKYLTDLKYKTWNFPAINAAPNTFDYQCGVAKTHVYNSMPEAYNNLILDTFDFDMVKASVTECLELDHCMNRSKMSSFLHKEVYTSEHKTLRHLPYEFSRMKMQTLLNNIFGVLGHREELCDVMLDRDVTVEACFHRHGLNRSKVLKKRPRNHILQNNAPFYGKHLVDFQIRKRTPLEEVRQTADL